jgi:hypothetical protein
MGVGMVVFVGAQIGSVWDNQAENETGWYGMNKWRMKRFNRE